MEHRGGKVCQKIFKSSKMLCVVMNPRLFLVGFHSPSQWISLSVCPKVFITQQIPVYKRIEKREVVQEYKNHTDGTFCRLNSVKRSTHSVNKKKLIYDFVCPGFPFAMGEDIFRFPPGLPSCFG